MNEKTVVVLGAGVGGLVAANELRRRLGKEHRVVLIEKNPRHAFAPSFLWVMTGARRPEQVAREVTELVRPGVEVMLAEARAIDLSARRVTTSSETLHYDYLIIALGAEFAWETIPGLEDAGYTFYDFDGAVKLRDALKTFDGGIVALMVSAMPYKCPGAPHEGAMLIADAFRKRGIREKVDLHLFTPEPQPMAVAGPILGEAVAQMLAGKGITYHPLHSLSTVSSSKRELEFEGKGAFKYDLLVTVPPHRSPRIVREAGLANKAGWVVADRATLQTEHEGVYAIGDVTSISIPGRWKSDMPLMLPKAGVFAHVQAEVVARRIADEIAGEEPSEEFGGDGYCMLEAGEGLAGFAYGDFFAEPFPKVELRQIGRVWHIGKVLLEKWWLSSYGLKREALRLAICLAGKVLRIPISA